MAAPKKLINIILLPTYPATYKDFFIYILEGFHLM